VTPALAAVTASTEAEARSLAIRALFISYSQEN
jgi:hypothetical protein